jgi:hypothetical protein
VAHENSPSHLFPSTPPWHAEQAKRSLKSPQYAKTAWAALKEMYRQGSDLRFDERWLVTQR